MLNTYYLLTLVILLSAVTLAFTNTCSNACGLDQLNAQTFLIPGGYVKYSNGCGAKLQCYGAIQCENWNLNLEFHTLLNICVENCNLTQELISCVLKQSYNVQTLHLFNIADFVEIHDLISAAPSLQHLKISNTKIKLTSKTTPKNLLNELEIEYGNITELPSNAFSGLSMLRHLRLRHNGITNISNDTFAGLSLLEELELSDNKLKVIPAKILRNLRELKVFNLDRNKIEDLPGRLFSSQGSYDKIKVSINHNKLKTFSVDTFSDARFESLSLADNELTLKNKWYFQQSLLVNVKVIHLNLSRNFIEKVFSDFGNSMTSLQTLDLSHNSITRYEDSAVNFSNKKYDGGLLVDLRYNKISNVKVKQKGLDEVRICFDHNPLHCNCELYNFATQLQNGFKRFLKTNPTCGTPNDLSGQSLRDISLSKFICNVLEPKCPKSCDCIRQPFSNEFQLNCKEVTTVPEHIEEIVSLKLNTVPSSLDSLPLSIDKLSLANLSLPDIPKLPENLSLIVLDLSNNTLKSVPEFLYNNSKTQLILGGNRFGCECEDTEHIEKLQLHYHQIRNYNELQCSNDRMVKTLNLKRECVSNWQVICGCVIGGIGFLGIVILFLYYRYKKNIKVAFYALGWFLPCIEELDVDQDKIYDAFVSFSHLDASLVAFELVPGLESQPHDYKLCLHYRDWIPGELITTQIVNSIMLSRRTIVILSKNFLKSEWARHEFRTAYAFALREGRVRIVVILLDDVANDETLDPELRSYLSNFTYIKWGDPWFWEKLRYALPHERQRKRKVKKHNRDKTKEESHELDIQSVQ